MPAGLWRPAPVAGSPDRPSRAVLRTVTAQRSMVILTPGQTIWLRCRGPAIATGIPRGSEPDLSGRVSDDAAPGEASAVIIPGAGPLAVTMGKVRSGTFDPRSWQGQPRCRRR